MTSLAPLTVLGTETFRDLVQEAGSRDAALQYLIALVTEYDRPIALNLPDERRGFESSTIMIAPPTWPQERLSEWVISSALPGLENAFGIASEFRSPTSNTVATYVMEADTFPSEQIGAGSRDHLTLVLVGFTWIEGAVPVLRQGKALRGRRRNAVYSDVASAIAEGRFTNFRMIAIRDSVEDVAHIGGSVLRALPPLVGVYAPGEGIELQDGGRVPEGRALALGWLARAMSSAAAVGARWSADLDARRLLVSIDRLPGDDPDRGRTRAIDLLEILMLLPEQREIWDIFPERGVPIRFGNIGLHDGSGLEAAKHTDGPVLADYLARSIHEALQTPHKNESEEQRRQALAAPALAALEAGGVVRSLADPS